MGLNAVEKKLLARLVRRGLISEGQSKDLAARAETEGKTIDRLAVEAGVADEKTITRQVARVNGLEFLDLDNFQPDSAIISHLSLKQAHRYRCIPVGIVDDDLVVAVADASDLIGLDELRALTSRHMRIVLATRSAIRRALERYYPSTPRPITPGSETESAEVMVHHRTDSSEYEVPSIDVSHETTDEKDPQDTLVERLPNDSEGKRLASLPTRVVSTKEISEYLREDQAETSEMARRAHEYFRRTGTSSDALPKDSAVSVKNEDWASEEALPRDPETGEAAIDVILGEMIDTAIENRAEELEFAPPTSRKARTRLRKEGFWLDATPYPSKYHEALVNMLKRLSGLAAGQSLPAEAHLSLKTRQGQIPAIVGFASTVRGERCVIRFPENLPLLQAPFRALGVDEKYADEFRQRLGGEGGGLLLITSPKPRLSRQLYASFLLDYTGEDRSIVSIDWTLERRIPGVHQLECPDTTSVLRAIEHVEKEEPDVVGIQSIPSGKVLSSAVALAIRGQTVLACLTTSDAAHAHRVVHASGVDRMTLTLCLIAHLHATRLPKLCTNCTEPRTRPPKKLPDWAHDIDPDSLRQALGCPICGGTGRKGINWICEVHVPDPSDEEGIMPLISREKCLTRLIGEGLLDLRDVR